MVVEDTDANLYMSLIDSNVWGVGWYFLASNMHLNGNMPIQWGLFAVVGNEISITCTNAGNYKP